MEASVETVLIAGIESVVGANLAASLSDRYQAVGLSLSLPLSVAGSQTSVSHGHDWEMVRNEVASIRPQRIVYCGTAAHSTWQNPPPWISVAQSETAIRNWTRAAREFECRLTVISSDAVFTGPWMFHKEDSTCLCASAQAQAIRSAEILVAQYCPDALLVRTNAYGWSPESTGRCWISETLADLKSHSAGPFDHLRYATPILTTDLTEILEQAWQNNLHGIYHVAGAERVNPNQFVEQLANEFGLPEPQPVNGNSLSGRPTGFGRGETSLHTNKIRKDLNIAMPMLADGLQRLRGQKQNDYCEQLEIGSQPVHEKVA